MNHGGDGLITPFPRAGGQLVLAVDDRGQELRLHETTPGFFSAYRWHQTHMGWCGALVYGLTPREWTAVGVVVTAEPDVRQIP